MLGVAAHSSEPDPCPDPSPSPEPSSSESRMIRPHTLREATRPAHMHDIISPLKPTPTSAARLARMGFTAPSELPTTVPVPRPMAVEIESDVGGLGSRSGQG